MRHPLLALLATLPLAAALVLARGSADEAGGGGEPPRRVRTAAVATAPAGRTIGFPGVTRAVRRAELAFPVAARLAERPVAAGQAVAGGAVVARLDGRELEHAVVAAAAALADVEARHARAESERRRVERLFGAAAATREELEQAEAAATALGAARDAAAVRLAEARRLAGETVLRAPFAGTVTDVSYEPGEFVPTGHPVVVLAGGDELEIEVRLPETVIGGIREGEAVRVELTLAGSATGGVVTRVGRAATATGGLYPVLVALDPGGGALPGMGAEVSFALGAGDALAVPLAAILNPGGARPRVFRLAGDVVEAVDIEVVELVGERVAVRGELAAGDRVIVTGHTALVPGDRVEVVP